MREKLIRMPMGQVPISRQETFKQVKSLATRGLKEIMGRFDEVDVRLDDVLAMFRDTPGAVAWIRRQRDWLVRTNHAWGVIFTNGPMLLASSTIFYGKSLSERMLSSPHGLCRSRNGRSGTPNPKPRV